ncbi:MAG: hypothetical protein LBG58_10535 [Planctomycetaceae bacterium]|jgi:hypothetical protein|nr:hypothetical protein [Planctomycetaceae bacterium]
MFKRKQDIRNISVEYSQTYRHRFIKPYFQPYFLNKTTLVARVLPETKPYYLIVPFF